MGAMTFMERGCGRNATEAFRHAREHAQWEHGHGGYTGSLAEKDDFVMITTTPMAAKDAEFHACKLIDADDRRISDKWGPAGCIPLEKDGEYLFFGWASS